MKKKIKNHIKAKKKKKFCASLPLMVKVGAIVEDDTNVNINVIDFITVLILATPPLLSLFLYFLRFIFPGLI